MNRWLVDECKHAREKAIKTRTTIAELSDPEWRSRRLHHIAAEESRLLMAVSRYYDMATERALLEDPAALSDHLARITREAETWENLASEQSARLEQTESEQEALIPAD